MCSLKFTVCRRGTINLLTLERERHRGMQESRLLKCRDAIWRRGWGGTKRVYIPGRFSNKEPSHVAKTIPYYI